MPGSLICSILARAAWVDKGGFDDMARELLTNRGALVLLYRALSIVSGEMQRQQRRPSVSTANCALEP